MEHTKSNVTFEREADDAILSLGHSGSGPTPSRTDDPVLELHYEVTIEHWVRDDRSRRNRFRWFVWDRLGIGDPPLRAETATADEVTTVTGTDSVPIVQNLPYRRLVKVVRRNAPESDHSKNPPRSA